MFIVSADSHPKSSISCRNGLRSLFRFFLKDFDVQGGLKSKRSKFDGADIIEHNFCRLMEIYASFF